jgi:hypothetical protein
MKRSSLAVPIALSVLLALASGARAVGTRNFELNTLDEPVRWRSRGPPSASLGRVSRRSRRAAAQGCNVDLESRSNPEGASFGTGNTGRSSGSPTGK